MHLLEELDISGNAAAAFATVAGSILADGGARAGRLRLRWRPGERPENRRAAGERIILLLIGVGVELVINALTQERLPEVIRLIITLQQALKWRDKGGASGGRLQSRPLCVWQGCQARWGKHKCRPHRMKAKSAQACRKLQASGQCEAHSHHWGSRASGEGWARQGM